jgi:hypothetical protein
MAVSIMQREWVVTRRLSTDSYEIITGVGGGEKGAGYF